MEPERSSQESSTSLYRERSRAMVKRDLHQAVGKLPPDLDAFLGLQGTPASQDPRRFCESSVDLECWSGTLRTSQLPSVGVITNAPHADGKPEVHPEDYLRSQHGTEGSTCGLCSDYTFIRSTFY